MKDLVLDANFPRTQDGRVYHLGVRYGEVANRIVTVGSPSRAHGIASFLDSSPKPFTLTSERGFLTITGRYKGVPVSIVSIGMGAPNADFLVREVRESLDGDMIVVRLGSCGALAPIPVGTVVLPVASVAVTRNYDFDFRNWTETDDEQPYRISKPVHVDVDLHQVLKSSLEAAKPPSWVPEVVSDTINASADSFYSSQGRQTSFPDHNADLIDEIQSSVPGVATLEMETFHILHLAASWPRHAPRQPHTEPNDPPLTAGPVSAHIDAPAAHQPAEPQPSTAESTAADPTSGNAPASTTAEHGQSEHEDGVELDMPPGEDKPAPSTSRSARFAPLVPNTHIRAAAAQMVFAQRLSQDFITPEKVAELEAWAGKGVLDALVAFEIEHGRLHPETGSVWALPAVEEVKAV
ncbi:purine and uridine phosphorylase [Punctularia strigosozonata HHB-11173 SS5]|uniref:purine and uridine phosphorylase n=1 Tax=Punctularia strigosozonata (strain HHB-11173) TaxID=741275 RepID=UPI00044177D2|nr:purine and uridine phosphorylase [Punctularia strigosozonata HHB-11173 SS5]EIN14751.1 purine and uridine phosphorylase [Punctularia strigosozonata HHB-11173 SS5]